MNYEFQFILFLIWKGFDNSVQNLKSLKSWSVHEVSTFIQMIPGCKQFAHLFEYQVS